jgi:hypothetical protein
MDITSGFVRWSVKVRYECSGPQNPLLNLYADRPKKFSENYIWDYLDLAVGFRDI